MPPADTCQFAFPNFLITFSTSHSINNSKCSHIRTQPNCFTLCVLWHNRFAPNSGNADDTHSYCMHRFQISYFSVRRTKDTSARLHTEGVNAYGGMCVCRIRENTENRELHYYVNAYRYRLCMRAMHLFSLGFVGQLQSVRIAKVVIM